MGRKKKFFKKGDILNHFGLKKKNNFFFFFFWGGGGGGWGALVSGIRKLFRNLLLRN